MPYKDKDKQREWNRKRTVRNANAIHELKSVPCKDCNNTFPHYVMEFDHVPERGKKKFSISVLAGGRSMNSPMMQIELAKCDIICANCHRVRTHKRLTKHKATNIMLGSSNLGHSPSRRKM